MAKKPGMTSKERIALQKAKNEQARIRQSVINRQKMDIKKISASIPRMRRSRSAFAQQSMDLKQQIAALQGIKKEVDRFGRVAKTAEAKIAAAKRADKIKQMDTARVAFRKAEHIGALQLQVHQLEKDLGMAKKPLPAGARQAQALQQRKYRAPTTKKRKTVKKGKWKRKPGSWTFKRTTRR